jgi:hypothetical protein
MAAMSSLLRHGIVRKPKFHGPCSLVCREAQRSKPAHGAATSRLIQAEYKLPKSNTQQRVTLTCFRCFAWLLMKV